MQEKVCARERYVQEKCAKCVCLSLSRALLHTLLHTHTRRQTEGMCKRNVRNVQKRGREMQEMCARKREGDARGRCKRDHLHASGSARGISARHQRHRCTPGQRSGLGRLEHRPLPRQPQSLQPASQRQLRTCMSCATCALSVGMCTHRVDEHALVVRINTDHLTHRQPQAHTGIAKR